MSPIDIQLVGSTWSRVKPIAGAAARLFYRRLFDVAPELRPMYTASISEQGGRWTSALADGVSRLDADAATDSDFLSEEDALIRDTLLWTLEQTIGETLCDDARAAWQAAFSTLAEDGFRDAALPADALALA